MPKVDGKKFPYTKKGIEAADKVMELPKKAKKAVKKITKKK